MERLRRHRLRPSIERIEPLLLLSNITNLMVINSQAAQSHAVGAFRSGGAGGGSSSQGFVPSTTSIAVPTNQGPQGTNLALAPTGTLTPHERKRERFTASFIGHYTVGPGRTSTEALQVHL